ncbi:MAG: M48 family metallopeptidase [Candidatus Beckwithbacteria bacterium]
MLNIYEQIDANKNKSNLIIGIFICFICVTAYILGQANGYGLSYTGFALIISGLISFSSYYYSDKIILTISRAKPASKKDNFMFYTVVENLCLATQLPMPKLYVINDTALNAFATGRDPKYAVICVTSGLLATLDRTELEGVIAHELSHIKNYDIRLMSIVVILVGMITLMADWFLRFSLRGKGKNNDNNQLQIFFIITGFILALLSPLIANLIKLAISRRRELLADASAVKITRFPPGLTRALEKISKDKEPLEAANKATAHLYISDPLKNRHDSIGWFSGLFNTHPPISQRLAALKQMS